ncbi:CRISPR-associated protein [Xenococcus sp. PCC 7305]|uniref:type III-B CRISPR-associated protein Cas10/Cmr2 n=1 Tax=Xenococcus sp. PCC 7305 TaxID=102125 RepID=UPI0002ACA471|nr:type III-B CRISPR-associated protein Cas10/Cmr2 [Xenococcus sp. PCC 7305]ELS04980.1 CRISPR-associated protein [Xenococcus sp. PCC 7305]
MVSKIYWQAKIWAILHDPPLKTLTTASQFLGREGAWQELDCMEGWSSPKKSNTTQIFSTTWLKEHIGSSDLIASASDRCAVTQLKSWQSSILYKKNGTGLTITHLLSGEKRQFTLIPELARLLETNQKQNLTLLESEPLEEIAHWPDPQQVFWYLWRCYPELLTQKLQPEIHLLPADTRIPDASLWSHVSMTSALAGSLAGYYQDDHTYPKYKQQNSNYSRPHIIHFSFSPVQEVIKFSRKMRDFWAGSWLIHYLSAKVCWKLANTYGPDTIIYPCLYQQPIIDHWLSNKYSDLAQFIEQPKNHQLLTAGFPNVIVMVLPNNGKNSADPKDNPVYAAVKLAKDTLQAEWRNLGAETKNSLDRSLWSKIDPKTWDSWLKCQWQFYSAGLPLGCPEQNLKQNPSIKDPDNSSQKIDNPEYSVWLDQQNALANPLEPLLSEAENQFFRQVFDLVDDENEPTSEKPGGYYAYKGLINVGTWWGSLLDQLRSELDAVKQGRNWKIPTVYGPRSTISGLGPVINTQTANRDNHWATEGDTQAFWSKQKGLFDGREELNATEVIKRSLHRILLKKILGVTEEKSQQNYYPDLTSGVAGWLKQLELQGQLSTIDAYNSHCQIILDKFNWINKRELRWGIPWITKNHNNWLNPRLLNSGWLWEDYPQSKTSQAADAEVLSELKQTISGFFKGDNNPTDWYVIAAGDGDGMGQWLSGQYLLPYENYIAPALIRRIQQDQSRIPEHFKLPLQDFLQIKKRMGPSTHSAFSRSLLDFANRLVPYLTEERYAGRLIYCGGDDILAYTNLWEWDDWLWDIRECFHGAPDPQEQFDNDGDYWSPKLNNTAEDLKELPKRPLFTLGSKATVSFGIIIAHQSVPLAISLENLWEAEAEAKKHQYRDRFDKQQIKDAVQVRAIFGSGNILKATAKFQVFSYWRDLVELANNSTIFNSGLFEQAVEIWTQHPAPHKGIKDWVKVFCSRRDVLQFNSQDQKQRAEINQFQDYLEKFISESWQQNPEDKIDREIKNWLKLAAFCLRNRDIQFHNSPSN